MDARVALLAVLVGSLLLGASVVVAASVWRRIPKRKTQSTIYSPQQWVDCFVFALLANGATAACGMPLTWGEALLRALVFTTICSLLAAARAWWDRRGGGGRIERR